jgi:hypothetical protein
MPHKFPHDEDPLSTMRGMVIGIVLGCVLWAVMIGAIVYWIRSV